MGEGMGGGEGGFSSTGGRGPGRPSRRSVEAVETHGTAGENAALGRWRGVLQPLAHHVRRTWEEAVGVWVVSRPQDLVGADEVREYLEAGFDRLERNPAVALEAPTCPISSRQGSNWSLT